MPHVIVKLWPGKSEQQKARLADKIAKDVMDVFNYGEESVSVGFEEIKSQEWKEKVYKPASRTSGKGSKKNWIRDVNHCESRCEIAGGKP
jgi:4-oxalocrotonate tautomerase